MHTDKTARLAVWLLSFSGMLYGQTKLMSQYHTATSTATTWNEREDAFYALLNSVPGTGKGHPWASLSKVIGSQSEEANTLGGDLIVALTKDVSWSQGQSSLTEEFTNYQGDLIATVTSLKDPRSIQVLFKLVGSGNMALNALAGFGDKALKEALLELQTRPGNIIRHSIMRLLAKMAEPANATMLKEPSSREALFNVLVSGLNDESDFVRIEAITGLGALRDPRAIPALAAVASSDQMRNPEGGAYLIRDKAVTAISRLSSQAGKEIR